MLVHRLRRWPNIGPTLSRCILFAGWGLHRYYKPVCLSCPVGGKTMSGSGYAGTGITRLLDFSPGTPQGTLHPGASVLASAEQRSRNQWAIHHCYQYVGHSRILTQKTVCRSTENVSQIGLCGRYKLFKNHIVIIIVITRVWSSNVIIWGHSTIRTIPVYTAAWLLGASHFIVGLFFSYVIYLKGLAQAKIIKKSVIVFWVLNMTIWCKHVQRLEVHFFLIFVLRIHQLG